MDVAHLLEEEIFEWQSKYLNLKKAENVLRSHISKTQLVKEYADSSTETVTTSSDDDTREGSHADFLHHLGAEFSIVEKFFAERFMEAESKLKSLNFALHDLHKLTPFHSQQGISSRVRRHMKELRSATMEFHLDLILLHRFQQSNISRLHKICEAYDRAMLCQSGRDWMLLHAEQSVLCSSSKKLERMILDVKNLFADHYSKDNPEKADAILHVPSKTEKMLEKFPSVFRNGLFIGASVVLTTLTVHAGVKADWESRLPDRQITVDLFRPIFLIIIFITLVAVNILGWERYNINRVLLLELDPRDHISHVHMFEIAGGLSVLWLSALYLYYSGVTFGFSIYIWPAAILVLSVAYLVNPFRIFHYKSRRWLLKLMFRTLAAPFYSVRLVDVWFTDQLISLVTLFVDLSFVICYYSSKEWYHHTDTSSTCSGMLYGFRPLMGVLPSWFRLAQCLRCYYDTRKTFPHLVNAVKYSTSFFVVLFSSLHASWKSSLYHHNRMFSVDAMFLLWLTSALVSSLYSFLWDIVMDWRLISRGSSGTRLAIRSEGIFGRKSVYYAAVVQNFILRFTWTLTMSIGEWSVIYSEIVRTIVAVLELFRRFIWNFFRLEVEQLANMGELRAVRQYTVELPESWRELLSTVEVESANKTSSTYGTFS